MNRDDMPVIITGAANIEKARLLTIRSALKLEVKGFRMSSGRRSARILANEAMGTNYRTKRETYEAFNKWLVENHGMEDRPL